MWSIHLKITFNVSYESYPRLKYINAVVKYAVVYIKFEFLICMVQKILVDRKPVWLPGVVVSQYFPTKSGKQPCLQAPL